MRFLALITLLNNKSLPFLFLPNAITLPRSKYFTKLEVLILSIITKIKTIINKDLKNWFYCEKIHNILDFF